MTEVPQIYPETGISGDYTNEYTGNLLGWSLDGFACLATHFRAYPMRTYEQRFSSQGYNNIITEQNRPSVQRINQIALELNYRVSQQGISPEEFISRINELERLIKGEYAKIFTVEDWEPQRK